METGNDAPAHVEGRKHTDMINAWTTPEAVEALTRMDGLVDQTVKRYQLIVARGTQADRVQMIVFTLELMVGLLDRYEIDPKFRERVRAHCERVKLDTPRQIADQLGRSLQWLQRFKIVLAGLR